MRNTTYLLLLFTFFGIGLNQLDAQNLKTFDPSKNAVLKPKKTKQKLATEYYSLGEYSKAVVLFEELYQEKNTSYFYKYLLYCYINLEDYRKAERLIKKTTKNNGKTYKRLSDLGYIQLKKGEAEKANNMFLKAIDELPSNRSAITELANDFRSRGQTELAMKTYFKGKELLVGEYQFENEIAYLYFSMEQYNQMTDEYLNLLGNQPLQLRTIQYRIQNAFRRDKDDVIYPYLKKELLKRIKKDTDKTQYSELLLWLSVQRKDFEIALIQAKSLDRRIGTEAYRVFDLSKVILSHGEYDLSIQALEYLVKLPHAKDQIYYPEAKQELLSARFKQLQQNTNPSKEDILFLKQEFETTLSELGKNRYTIQAVMEHSEFLSFYLDKQEEAIEELEDILASPGIGRAKKAPVKLLLGDLYLLNDNPWDATLLYSQVEKDFKNDEIGFDARFRNAKLSFYIGEFDWAKAQLDILKASTGKKIANDAMRLSLFIAENLDADSSTRALELYGRAELLHLQKKDSLAIQTFDSIFMMSLYHEIFDNVWFHEAQMYYKAHQYKKTKTLLEKIIDQYPDGLLADDALWQLGNIEMEIFNNTQIAAEYFKLILTDYPISLHSQEARTLYRKIRGDLLENKNADSN